MEEKPNGSLIHNPLARLVQEIKASTHGKVRKVEYENVGVEAGHKGEELAARGVSYMWRKVREGVHHHRTTPWWDAAKAEQALIWVNADFLYQKAFHDDPAMTASNPVSRYLQKKRIQRNYAKQIRQTEKTAKDTGAAVSSAAKRVKEAAQETVAFVGRHWKGVILVVGIGASSPFCSAGFPPAPCWEISA